MKKAVSVQRALAQAYRTVLHSVLRASTVSHVVATVRVTIQIMVSRVATVLATIMVSRAVISLAVAMVSSVAAMVSSRAAMASSRVAIVHVIISSQKVRRVDISLGGGYGQQRGGYGQQRGGYGQQRGGYGQQRGGYGQQKQRGGYRQHTADYDPNAKYSLKKRIEYKEENFDPNEPVRLNKFLANAGVCSRREADEFIQAGVVTVNGEVVTELGTKILRTDTVMFHDTPVTPEKKVYVLLNKPKDYVTTSDDPQQRKTVMDLVKGACQERIYPVGRLDRNTTGVLLLTNDGDMASKLTHPKFLKKKIYHVYLDKNVTAHDMQQIAEGIMLDDGEIKADDIQYADPVDKKQVGIEIHSGKNRIVRRIFESLGYRVTKLDRVQFAGLTKKNLRRGDWRYLTEEEVDRLRMGAYE